LQQFSLSCSGGAHQRLELMQGEPGTLPVKPALANRNAMIINKFGAYRPGATRCKIDTVIQPALMLGVADKQMHHQCFSSSLLTSANPHWYVSLRAYPFASEMSSILSPQRAQISDRTAARKTNLPAAMLEAGIGLKAPRLVFPAMQSSRLAKLPQASRTTAFGKAACWILEWSNGRYGPIDQISQQ
jgi:hypothetical protein